MLDKAYNAGKADGSSIHYDCPNRWWWSNGTGSPYYTITTATSSNGTSDSNVTINTPGYPTDGTTYASDNTVFTTSLKS